MRTKKGFTTISLFCQHCKRIWAGTVPERHKAFGATFNNLACPWCGYRESVPERPEHHNEAVNADFVPTIADREMIRVVEELVESSKNVGESK